MKIYHYFVLVLLSLFVRGRTGYTQTEVTRGITRHDNKIRKLTTKSSHLFNKYTTENHPASPHSNVDTIKTNPATNQPASSSSNATPNTLFEGFVDSSGGDPNFETGVSNTLDVNIKPKIVDGDDNYDDDDNDHVEHGRGTGDKEATENDKLGSIANVDDNIEVKNDKGDKDAGKKEATGNVVDAQQENTSVVKLFEVAAITAGICLLLLLLNFVQLVLVIRIFGTRQKDKAVIEPLDVPQIVITKDEPSMQTFVELDVQNHHTSTETNTEEQPSNTDEDEKREDDEYKTNIKNETNETSDDKNVRVDQGSGAKLNESEVLFKCSNELPATDTAMIDLDDFPPPPDVLVSGTDGQHETNLVGTKNPNEMIASLDDEVKRLVDFADADTSATCSK